jgi:hypothetical protein
MRVIPDNLLNSIPDWNDWEKVSQWVENGQRNATQLSKESLHPNSIFSLEWNDLREEKEWPFGYYCSSNWRKFTLAAFLADVISYAALIDQVNFERLVFLMHCFPQGFRVWWIKSQDGNSWWPVGYTGWYPMLETAFDTFEKTPENLRDRMVVPDPSSQGKRPFLYLYNFSVVPALKKSTLSKALMEKYSHDIYAQKVQGLASISVSEDGVRMANRFGLKCSGYLKLENTTEDVFVKRVVPE